MKKILVMCLMLMMSLSTVVFGAEDVYEVIVDGQLQGYVGEDLEDGVYIPYVGLVSTLGEENLPQVDKAQLAMKNINGFQYISSDAIQANYDVFVLVDENEKELKLYSLTSLLEKVSSLEQTMKKTAPDLYTALKKTGEETYSFSASVNGLLDIDYRSEQMAQAIGVNNAFLSSEISGYMNSLQEDFELTMSSKIDAAPLMTENIRGMGIKKVGNEIYVQDPASMTWMKESIDESYLQERTATAVEDNTLLWLLAEDMDRIVNGQQTIYKSSMTEADVKSLIDGVTGQGVYQDMKDDIQSNGFSYNIDTIEVTYLLEGNTLIKQSFFIECSLSGIQGTATLVLSMDANYTDYGVIKTIDLPEAQPLSVELQ